MSVGLSMSEVAGSAGLTAGGMLREARQAAGMHIAALAVALKVPVSKLEALEADNYEALPDTVFVRALASSVCRTLKLDAAPVLSLLPQSKSPRLSTDSAGLNAPVKASMGKSSASSSSSSTLSRPVVVVVLVLLLGAAAVFFMPRQQGAITTSTPVDLPSSSSPAAPVDPETLSSANDATGAASAQPEREPEPAVPTASSLVGSAPAALASAAPATGVASGPAAGVAPVAAASATATPAGTLVLRARSESWVQVRDSAGGLALQRNLVAGESVSVAGSPPYAVVIGRADATEVFVRGKPFDLSAVSRENVARFEVK